MSAFWNYIWNVQSLSKLHSFWISAMTVYKGTAWPADKHQFQHNGKNICWNENKCTIVFVWAPPASDNAYTIWTMDETFHLGCRWRSSRACVVRSCCLKAICWVWEHNHWWCCNIRNRNHLAREFWYSGEHVKVSLGNEFVLGSLHYRNLNVHVRWWWCNARPTVFYRYSFSLI